MDDPMQVDQPLLGLPFDHQNEFKEAFLINPTELWNRVTTVDQEDSKPSVEDSLANTILVESLEDLKDWNVRLLPVEPVGALEERIKALQNDCFSHEPERCIFDVVMTFFDDFKETLLPKFDRLHDTLNQLQLKELLVEEAKEEAEMLKSECHMFVRYCRDWSHVHAGSDSIDSMTAVYDMLHGEFMKACALFDMRLRIREAEKDDSHIGPHFLHALCLLREQWLFSAMEMDISLRTAHAKPKYFVAAAETVLKDLYHLFMKCPQRFHLREPQRSNFPPESNPILALYRQLLALGEVAASIMGVPEFQYLPWVLFTSIKPQWQKTIWALLFHGVNLTYFERDGTPRNSTAALQTTFWTGINTLAEATAATMTLIELIDITTTGIMPCMNLRPPHAIKMVTAMWKAHILQDDPSAPIKDKQIFDEEIIKLLASTLAHLKNPRPAIHQIAEEAKNAVVSLQRLPCDAPRIFSVDEPWLGQERLVASAVEIFEVVLERLEKDNEKERVDVTLNTYVKPPLEANIDTVPLTVGKKLLERMLPLATRYMGLLPGIHRWIGFYTMMFFAVAKQLRDGLVVAEHAFSTAKEPQQSPRLEVPQQKDGVAGEVVLRPLPERLASRLQVQLSEIIQSYFKAATKSLSITRQECVGFRSLVPTNLWSEICNNYLLFQPATVKEIREFVKQITKSLCAARSLNQLGELLDELYKAPPIANFSPLVATIAKSLHSCQPACHPSMIRSIMNRFSMADDAGQWAKLDFFRRQAQIAFVLKLLKDPEFGWPPDCDMVPIQVCIASLLEYNWAPSRSGMTSQINLLSVLKRHKTIYLKAVADRVDPALVTSIRDRDSSNISERHLATANNVIRGILYFIRLSRYSPKYAAPTPAKLRDFLYPLVSDLTETINSERSDTEKPMYLRTRLNFCGLVLRELPYAMGTVPSSPPKAPLVRKVIALHRLTTVSDQSIALLPAVLTFFAQAPKADRTMNLKRDLADILHAHHTALWTLHADHAAILKALAQGLSAPMPPPANTMLTPEEKRSNTTLEKDSHAFRKFVIERYIGPQILSYLQEKKGGLISLVKILRHLIPCTKTQESLQQFREEAVVIGRLCLRMLKSLRLLSVQEIPIKLDVYRTLHELFDIYPEWESILLPTDNPPAEAQHLLDIVKALLLFVCCDIYELLTTHKSLELSTQANSFLMRPPAAADEELKPTLERRYSADLPQVPLEQHIPEVIPFICETMPKRLFRLLSVDVFAESFLAKILTIQNERGQTTTFSPSVVEALDRFTTWYNDNIPPCEASQSFE